MAKRAALILSGGKSRRFQTQNQEWQDKALAQLDGKPMLIHVIEKVQSVTDEIAVCVNNQERKDTYEKTLKEQGFLNIKLVVDEKMGNINGPNLAITSGLRSIQADYCLTLPCDMPFLVPEVAEYLFSQEEGVEVVVPMWPNGRLETLMMVLERKSALEISETLCVLNRPRSDDIPRGASKVQLVSPLKEIKGLDPEFKSFININSKEDLNQLQTRRSLGPVKENLQLSLGILSISDLRILRESSRMLKEDKILDAQKALAFSASNFEICDSFYWAALAQENLGATLLTLSKKQSKSKASAPLEVKGKEAYMRAAKNFRREARIYESNRCLLLAELALADKTWCESLAIGKAGHAHRWPKKAN
jgi:molybdopterin-guanine dinucleotide biosynthesis protein A